MPRSAIRGHRRRREGPRIDGGPFSCCCVASYLVGKLLLDLCPDLRQLGPLPVLEPLQGLAFDLGGQRCFLLSLDLRLPGLPGLLLLPGFSARRAWMYSFQPSLSLTLLACATVTTRIARSIVDDQRSQRVASAAVSNPVTVLMLRLSSL
jgi:hypothetical protein